MQSLMTILVALASCLGGNEPDGIAWRGSLAEALEEASQQDKPILIAFNMDKERANDQMARKHYRNPEIVALSRHFVSVICSKYRHAEETEVECPRFGAVTCQDHVSSELTCRRKFLDSDTVNSPQHLFVKSDGTVFRAKVWLMSEKEMISLMKGVLVELYPQRHKDLVEKRKEPKAASKAKDDPKDEPKPRKEEEETEPEPMTPTEILSAIANTDETYRIRDLARRLIESEDKTQRDVVVEMIGDKKTGRKRQGLALAFGFKGNKDGVKVLAPLLSDRDPDVRNHAAVALEDIMEKSALKSVDRALRNEKEEAVRKNLVRALGASANGDRRAIDKLTKLTRDKSDLVQRNAIFALGYFKKNKSVEKTLLDIWSGKTGGGGGRGGGGWRRRYAKVEMAAYSLAMMESRNAMKAVEKRLDREKNDRIIELLEGFVTLLEDPAVLEEKSGRGRMYRIAGDKIQRDGGPEVESGNRDRGRDGNERRNRGRRGGDGEDG